MSTAEGNYWYVAIYLNCPVNNMMDDFGNEVYYYKFNPQTKESNEYFTFWLYQDYLP